MTEGIELPNKKKPGTLREKTSYKNFGILEVVIIKHAEMKEKIKKDYLKRTGNYSKPNNIAEISSKG